MHTRLSLFIKYQGISKKEFADSCGWKPQYLQKLLTGVNFGIKAVHTILEIYPELNARWLITGEGEMLNHKPSDKLKERLIRLMQLEKYIPVMTPEEIKSLESEDLNFGYETIAGWESLLKEKNEQLNNRYTAAKDRQEKDT